MTIVIIIVITPLLSVYVPGNDVVCEVRSPIRMLGQQALGSAEVTE